MTNVQKARCSITFAGKLKVPLESSLNSEQSELGSEMTFEIINSQRVCKEEKALMLYSFRVMRGASNPCVRVSSDWENKFVMNQT